MLTKFPVTVNSRLSAPAKRVIIDGEEYLEAPCTSIVHGVLPGSQGPLYYPPSSIKHNVREWDKVPITLYHPTASGKHVSAKHPGVLNRQWLGWVSKSKYDEKGEKLRHSLLFHSQRTKDFHNDLYNRLLRGDPIEVSTGLFTDNHPAEFGANYKGRSYTHIARNYRPDHIAILPDQIGACSVSDGCGVFNSNSNKTVCKPGKLKPRPGGS